MTRSPGFNRSTAELEELLLFSIFAANKPAKLTATKPEWFLTQYHCELRRGSPFRKLRSLIVGAKLEAQLKWARLSPYTKNLAACRQLARLDKSLGEISLNELLQVHGVGDKTARMFLLYSREDQPYAVLDTYVLSWLKRQGHEVPPHHPTGNVYRRLEIAFLDEADKLEMTALELDRAIWTNNAIGSDQWKEGQTNSAQSAGAH